MKNIKKHTLFFVIIAFTLLGCTTETDTNTKHFGETIAENETSSSDGIKNNSETSAKSIVHYNIIISPDLSNRIQKEKPVRDEVIVESIVRNVLPNVLYYKRKTNQLDRYSISFISDKPITRFDANTNKLKIDFGRFDKQLQRIDYIKNRSAEKLSEDQKIFSTEFSRIISSISSSPDGADIWKYFDQTIDNTLVISETNTVNIYGENFTTKHKNILILLTDGYIEAGLYGKDVCKGNKCYYLSGEKIKAFRTAFKKSGSQDLKDFFNKNNYGIIPARNPHLNNLEVLVMQMDDRSLDKAGNSTAHPTDREILELFWSDWLTKSGVKKFKLTPVYPSKDQAEKVILDFIKA